MTKLEKPLTRLCPDIKDDQERELTVTIQPSGQGGELLLHWNRDKKKAGDRTFQFKDLSNPEQEQPTGWGTWVQTETLKSQISISPGIDIETTNLLHAIIDRAALSNQWLEEETDLEWEDYLRSKGREDLVHLSCDDERPELVAAREKREAAEQRRKERLSNGDDEEE